MSTTHPLLRFRAQRRLPVILQAEAAECGLACIAMVACFLGHRTDLAAMRRQHAASRRGATLRSLIDVAAAMAMRGRPLKLGIEHLPELRLPCVLHWDMNHFVVLKKVTAGGIELHDPAAGARCMSMQEASLHFTGVALELAPTPDFAPVADTRPLRWRDIIGHVTGLERGLLQLLALGIALQVCALLGPFFLQWTVDEALLAGDRDMIVVLGTGFVLLALLQAAIGAVRSWVTTTLAADLNFQWLGNAFAHLMRLPADFFEKRHLGDIVSRFASIQAMQKALTAQLVEAVVDGVLVVFTLVLMAIYSVKLTAVAVGAVAVHALVRRAAFRFVRRSSVEELVHAARQQTLLLESARGVQAVQLFGRQEERRIAWSNAVVDQFNAQLATARATVASQAVGSFLFGAERVVVIVLGALAVLDARLTVGMLFAFLGYKDQFTQRTAALVDRCFELGVLKLHGERVADLMAAEAAPRSLPGVDTSLLEPSIEFRDVGFRYSPSDPYVLRHVSFRVAAGECVAITGPSGAGKTTLVKLLLGLVDPVEGEILVGGMRIDRLGLDNYRTLLASVLQDDHLFTGSVADNIAFFDPSHDELRVHHAARAAALHEEILAMPMGYHTLIGDLGSGLSGGQKQRLLLARAIYKRPRILVADEATSHLDLGNESAVNTALSQLRLTRILVAHRPQTIAMADRVFVIAAGRCTE